MTLESKGCFLIRKSEGPCHWLANGGTRGTFWTSEKKDAIYFLTRAGAERTLAAITDPLKALEYSVEEITDAKA